MTSKDAGERGLLTYLSCIGRRTDAFVRRAGVGEFKTAAVYRYDPRADQWRPAESFATFFPLEEKIDAMVV